jgi:hypothetical protein
MFISSIANRMTQLFASLAHSKWWTLFGAEREFFCHPNFCKKALWYQGSFDKTMSNAMRRGDRF